jgi:glyoxylase-like metal-dependent hydrolase (beta-lactamase superfamily II)
MTLAIVRLPPRGRRLFVAMFLLLACIVRSGEPTSSHLRLYVFDNGSLLGVDPAIFGMTRETVAATEMVATSYLIVHPKGTLQWDAGVIPDEEIKAGNTRVVTKIYTAVVPKTLEFQLAQVGYAKKDITYFALSHAHGDHAGNANDFAGSTWLVQKPERDAMFSEKRSAAQRVLYSALANSQTRLLEGDNFDVFGDGAVVIIAAYGHTAGHQVLQIKLANTGLVILAGDLYHYQEQRGLNKGEPNDFNKEQSVASRRSIEALVKKTGAQLWLSHDFSNFKKLKIAPAYYD